MIATTKYPTDAFEDAIEATVFMATVHVREGEMALPTRIREHLADGPVVVHLMRGEHDVAVHEATLTSRSTLTGITWPEDVLPRTSLTVLCPRGGASHDIGVLLPELQGNVDWPDDDLPAAEPETEPDIAEPEPEPEAEPEVAEAAEPVSDEQLAAITGALTAFADAAVSVESTLPGPADYATPTTLQVVERDEQPTETIDAVCAEQTSFTPVVGDIEWPPAELDYEPEDAAPVDDGFGEDEEPFTPYLHAVDKSDNEDSPGEDELAALETIDLDHDYRPRWRRALAWARTNMTPVRAAYIAATSGTFVGSLVTWLVTR